MILDQNAQRFREIGERLINNNSEYLEYGHNFNILHDSTTDEIMYRNPSKWEENTGIIVIVLIVNVIVHLLSWG